MTEKEKATKVIDTMYNNDAFSQWLGIERIEEGPGYCTLKMTIRKEMTNGFNIAHGGITFSFADSAFAFASNSHGRQSVSIETSISHLEALKTGDVIFAFAKEVSLKHKVAFYQVDIKKGDDTLVATFKGTVYRSSKTYEV